MAILWGSDFCNWMVLRQGFYFWHLEFLTKKGHVFFLPEVFMVFGLETNRLGLSTYLEPLCMFSIGLEHVITREVWKPPGWVHKCCSQLVWKPLCMCQLGNTSGWTTRPAIRCRSAPLALHHKLFLGRVPVELDGGIPRETQKRWGQVIQRNS